MKAVAALMLMIIAVCTVGCVKDSGNSSYYGHECVDLGLPSGTLWASLRRHTIGATTSIALVTVSGFLILVFGRIFISPSIVPYPV